MSKNRWMMAIKGSAIITAAAFLFVLAASIDANAQGRGRGNGRDRDDDRNGGYSTISLGYAGLYECVKYMTGKSHTDPSATPFALSIMQKMNDKCKEWKTAENIDYSLYGTPLESTTYKFAKCLQRRFGIIPGVTDKGYITNSYHVHVTEKIDAFTKLKFEAQFQHGIGHPLHGHAVDAVLELLDVEHGFTSTLYLYTAYEHPLAAVNAVHCSPGR